MRVGILMAACLGASILTAVAGSARADGRRQLADAISEAKQATSANDMDEVRLHLRHALNCVVGRKSGSYYAPDGDSGPCTNRESTASETTQPLARQWLMQAENLLGGGQVKSDLPSAHDYAEDAVKLMQKAQSAFGVSAGPANAPTPAAAEPAPAAGAPPETQRPAVLGPPPG